MLLRSVLFVLVTLQACTSFAQLDYTRFVNPFIGTGGHGHTYPGATLPFGMVQLSPDTRLDGWDGCGGYHYTDSIVYGFSHTHLSGTGVSDYGDLLIMPYDPNTTPKDVNGQLISHFSHTQEHAEPGYYSIHLIDGNIDAEFTASKHCGIHHYTYQENQPAMVIDLNHRDELISYEIAPVNGTRLVGKRVSKAWAKEQTLYFVIDFSQPFTITGTELDGKRLFLSFNQSNQLYVKVGISAVDIAGAEKNLSAELPNWDFDTFRQQAKETWNNELRKIEVFSADNNFLISYYTALYHSFLNPNVFSDVDGRYRGMDNKIHTTTSEQYTVFSLWDTFRALHPLFTLVQQEKTNSFIQTFLNQYKEGGRLPVWELAGNETDCMIGYPAVSVITDAFVKGINKFDPNLALEAMISISKEDRLGKKAFHEKGFIPVEEESESVSKALEYAYNDWCIATMAKKLGKNEIADEYFRYAQFYKNIFNPANGFMQAKLNNSFHEPFDPREVNFNYTEANSWQYSFFVPQDLQHWIQLQGGRAQAAAKLDALFASSNQTTGRTQADITGLIGQYAHGNEPSHHIAFLYNYVGQPWKAQEKTEEIIRMMYSNAPDGLSGNEDCGQMSAWLNMTALGLYQVTPGLAQYTLTVPHLDSACIHLENGKTWWVKCRNRAPFGQNYIQTVLLNGVAWNNSYLQHAVLMEGGEMTFVLGNQPSNWAIGENTPYSSIDAPEIATTPYFDSQKTTFEGTKSIELKSLFPQQKIHYTLDGNQPTATSPLYRYPIIIDKTTTIRAISIADNGSVSPEVKQTYHLIQSDRSISIQSHYSSQYSAGGDAALIDQQRGGNDFRSGAWQGYQGESFKAVIHLNSPKTLHKVGAEFIQDARSWIWMPRKLTIWLSMDSIHWNQVTVIQNTVPENDYTVTVKEFVQEIPATKANYIRYEAEQMGTIPEWHLGHGGESFIFVDELIAE